MAIKKIEEETNIEIEMRAVYKNATTPLKARASVVINGCFVVHNVRLVNAGNGMFISMPANKRPDGKWRDNCHPITREFSDKIKAAMIEAYEADERQAE